ncbi:MAG TPA: hypothetical protein VGJ18_03030 [Gemmatimonadaceae bacterium]
MELKNLAESVSRVPRGVARRSLSRKLLLQLLALQPGLSLGALALRLGVQENRLRHFEDGQMLMPLDVQGRLSAFVLAHEPRLQRHAHRLRLQVDAARRYEAGEVVRHMTSPP